MRKCIALLLVLALALPLSACGSRSGERIAVMWWVYGDTFGSSVRAAMEQNLLERGIPFQMYDANGSQTTQTEQIQIAIASGVTALAVNMLDGSSDDAVRIIIDMARNAEVPLVFFNHSVNMELVESYDKCAYVGTDYTMAGHMQGQMIGEYLTKHFEETDINGDGVISYVMFKGQEGNIEADARTQYGVEDADAVLTAAGLPKLQFYDAYNASRYLVDQNGLWSAAQGQEYMQTILAQYNEDAHNAVELVIANNDDMALGAISALQAAGYNNGTGRTIPVYGVDATDAAQGMINAGFMEGTVRQDGQTMARTVITIAANLIAGREKFDSLDPAMLAGPSRINIPYSLYLGD